MMLTGPSRLTTESEIYEKQLLTTFLRPFAVSRPRGHVHGWQRDAGDDRGFGEGGRHQSGPTRPCGREKNKEAPIKEYTVVQSDENLAGTRLSYPVRMFAQINESNEAVCIPAGFPLRGLGVVTNEGAPVMLRAINHNELDENIKEYGDCDAATFPQRLPNKVSIRTAIGAALIVSQKDNAMYTAKSNGLSYGALYVPFKYHLSGSRDFDTSFSVGPYAGYKYEISKWAVAVEVVGFAGIGFVQAERLKDGKPDAERIAAFSYGAAVIGRIKRDIQLGLVLGQDRTGKSSDYKDNGKWWLSLSIGFPFSR